MAAPAAHAQLTVNCVPATGPVEVGVAYTTTCTPTGGTGPYSFMVSSGALPNGINLSTSPAATLTISGTPMTGGSYTYTIQAQDTVAPNATGTVTFTPTVAAAPSVTGCTGTLPDEVGAAYSQTCSVTGGVGPFSWSIFSGTAPGDTLGANCTSGSASCTISGVPVTGNVGPYSFTLRATDANSQPANQSFSGTVAAALSANCTRSGASTEVGVTANPWISCSLTGGVAPYIWSIGSGSLPGGMSPPSPASGTSSTISGTFSATGSYSFQVAVKDSASTAQSGSFPFSGTVAAPLTITNCTGTTAAEVGVAYSETCNASGGTPPYSWSISSGSIPGGSLQSNCTNTAACTVSGTPVSSGPYSYTLQLADSSQNVTQTFSGTIAALVTATCNASPVTFETGESYLVSCSLTGGISPFTWSVIGTLPSGVTGPSPTSGTSTSVGGTFAGTGSFSFQVKVADSASTSQSSTSGSFSATVVAGPTYNCTSTSSLEANVPYSMSCMATGGTGGYTWGTTSLPSWLTLMSSGANATISGTPGSANVGSVSYALHVTDSASPGGVTYARTQGGNVLPAPSVNCNLTTGPVEQSDYYSTTCSVSGGSPPYAWGTGGTVPNGLSLMSSGSAATVSGFPTGTGAYNYSIQATDSATTPQTGSQTFTTPSIAPALTLSCTNPAGPAEVGVAYSNTCTVSNGVSPYTWSAIVVPAGLTATPAGATLTISGSPTTAGTFSYTVKVTDSASPTVSQTAPYSGTIVAPLTITCTVSSGPPEQNDQYSGTCTAAGGTPPYAWSVTGGSLPNGLSFASGSNTAIVSGSPSGTGAYGYSIQVMDSAPTPQSKTQAYSGTIASALTLSCTNSSAPTEVGVAYSNTCSAVNGIAPYNWSIAIGSLPSGLTAAVGGANNSTYTISGTPSAVGNFSYRIAVTDSAASLTVPNPPPLGSGSPVATQSKDYSGQVFSAPSVACTVTSGPPEQGDPYSTKCTVTGGTPTYTWTISSGSLSGGLGLTISSDTTSATISGTPANSGAYAYVLQVTDNALSPRMATQSFSGSSAPALSFSCTDAAGSGPTELKVPYSDTCTVTAGTGLPPYTWTIVNGTGIAVTGNDLPPGLTAVQSGTNNSTFGISGTPTSGGNFSYRVQVTDSANLGNSGSVAATQGQGYSGTVFAQVQVTCTVASGPVEQYDSYSTTCTASGGSPPYSWATVGTLPGGLTLSQRLGGDTSNSKAIVSGVPATAGPYSFSIQATDNASVPLMASQPYSGTTAGAVAVSCVYGATSGGTSPLAGSLAASGPTEVNVPYSAVCTAANGIAPYNWTIINSTGTAAGVTGLPPGLTAATGGATRNLFTIAGAPTASAAGTFSYRILVTDSASTGNTGSPSATQYTAATEGGLPLPQGDYSGQIARLPNYSCTQASSNVVGQVTGTYPFSGPVEDNLQYTVSCSASGGQGGYGWTIKNLPFVTGSGQFSVTGNTSASAVAAGQTLTVQGSSITIQGTYSSTSTAGNSYDFTVAMSDLAVDSAGNNANQNSTAGPPPFTGEFKGTTKPAPRVTCTDSAPIYSNFGVTVHGPPEQGVTYEAVCTITPNTGTPPYTWQVPGGLPSGLTLATYNANGSIKTPGTNYQGTIGTVTGTAAFSGPFNYTVTFVDAYGVGPAGDPTNNNNFAGSTLASPSVTCDPPTPPLQAGVPYSSTCTVKGGLPPYTWSQGLPFGSGSFQNMLLPPGLSLTPDQNRGITAVISGSVATAPTGVLTFAVTVSDSAQGVTSLVAGGPGLVGGQPQKASQFFGGTLQPPLQITCSSNAGPTEVGVPFSLQCKSTGGTPPYTFSLQGDAPPGIVMNSQTGIISGAALTPGGYSFSAAVLDSAVTPCSGSTGTGVGLNVCPASQQALSPLFTGTVASAPAVTCDQNTPAPYELGVSYSLTCRASGGQAPYSWSASGLPAGLTCANCSASASSVTISGQPTAIGSYSFAVQVKDSLGSVGTQVLSGAIAPVLSVATTGSGTFIPKVQGTEGSGSVTVVTTNASSGTVTGTAEVDIALTSGLTATSTANTDASWNCTTSPQSVQCTRATGALSSNAQFPPVIVNVAVSDQACVGSPVTASVKLNGQTQTSTTTNVSANGCLTITKSHTSSFPAGGSGTYTLTVSNSSAVPISGPIQVTDQLDNHLTVDPTQLQASQNGWSCVAPAPSTGQPSTLACTFSGGAPASTAIPSITLPVTVATGGCGLVADAATVQLGSFVEASVKDPTSISGNSCLNVTGYFSLPPASAGATSIPAGTTGIYNLTLNNIGESPIPDPITLTVTLPAGVSLAGSSWTDSSWTCPASGTLQSDGTTQVPCTNTPPFGRGADPQLTLYVTGSPAGLTCGVVNAQAQAAWDNFQSNSTSIPTSILGSSCMTLSQTHQGNVAAGGTGVFTLAVSNPNPGSGSPPAVEVTEALPAGITAAGELGKGWNCSTSTAQTLDCVYAATDNPSTYPPITVNLNAGAGACTGFIATASLAVNGTQQASASDNTLMTGCFSVTEQVPSSLNINQQGATYTLAVSFLGQNSVSGALTLQQTLPAGLVPTGTFTDPNGNPFGDGDWSCQLVNGDPQSFTCTRPATGTYTPIAVATNVGLDACPEVVGVHASLALDGTVQAASNSSSVNILPLSACPGTPLSLTISHDTNPSGGTFTPNMANPATYTLLVQNIGTAQTSGTVVVTDNFNLGVRATAIQGNNWTCDSIAPGGVQVVNCSRSDSLAPGQSYDPILISVAIDANACPSATDRPVLTLSGKTQNIPPTDQVPLRGCIGLSPSTISFAPVHLGNTSEVPANKSVTLIANDQQPLNITIHPLAATSAFSVTSPSCTGSSDLSQGNNCTVSLSQSAGIVLNVAYNPSCIGTQNDSLTYSTDIPNSQAQTVPLMGQAILQSLSLVQVPGSQSLAGTTVQPATSINLGLNATPGFCLPGQPSTVTPTIQQIGVGSSAFQGQYDTQPVQYDEMIVPCPSGTSGCLDTLKTGTVAGVITLNAQFNGSNGQDVGYAGNTMFTMTVPLLPPVLTAMSKGSVTGSSFQIPVTGYSTPRRNTQVCFQFTAAQGSQLDLSALGKCYSEQDIANSWDRLSAIATGSMFTITETFSYSGDPNAIGTVEAWLQNDLGTSNHMCLNFKSGSSAPGSCQ